MLLNSMCIQGTTVGYWQLQSRWSQYLYPDIYDTHVLYYVKYDSCSSRPLPASEGRTATGGHIEHPTQMNILKLYDNCYIILIIYILDSALEPSYNFSRNLLLLPWILKLIVDNMVNDSTPLCRVEWNPLHMLPYFVTS